MIKWGIIGAGNIAKKFAQTLKYVEGAELYAVSNRSLEKAKEFKRKYPCEIAYGSYQELLDDENVDVVYISLPHSLHFEWSIKAIKAGKAVLCEKPSALNFDEINEVVNFARENNIFYMEAMKGRFTPGYKKMKSLIDEGVIGKIESIYTSLCRVFPLVENSRLYETVEGSCLLDMGVYNVGFIEDFVSEPYILENIEYEMYKNLVEIYVNAKFKLNDISVIIESAFDRDKESKAVIKGTKGEIIAEDFHRLTKFMVKTVENIENYEIPCEVNDFYGQIIHVNNCLKSNVKESPIMTFENLKNVAKIIDEMKSKILI